MADWLFTRRDRETLITFMESYRNNGPERRFIGLLKERLSKSKPVESFRANDRAVALNSKITLRDLGTGSLEEYLIVMPGEARPGNGTLSVLTDIGSSVLGNREGSIIHLSLDPEKYYSVERIMLPHELRVR